MPTFFIKATALTFAFVGFVFTGQAEAVPALSFDASLVVPVVDQEDLSVEEDLEPDVPPAAMDGEEPEKSMMGAPEGEMESKKSGDMEDEMIDKIGPGAE